MKKPLKIMVPFDFSPLCRQSLKLALSLQEQFDSTYLLLHVVPSGEVEDFAGMGGSSREALEARLKEAEAELEGEVAGLAVESVEARVVSGVPYAEICRIAEEGRFGLIVIGTHGRRGLSHLLIGSTAEKVVQHAPCPVLSCKSPLS